MMAHSEIQTCQASAGNTSEKKHTAFPWGFKNLFDLISLLFITFKEKFSVLPLVRLEMFSVVATRIENLKTFSNF